jgi:hypothetical protein
MGEFVLTMIIIVYGGTGAPVTTATINHDYTSKDSCEQAAKFIAGNIRDGDVTHSSCLPR